MSHQKDNLSLASKLDEFGDFYTTNPSMRALAALAGLIPGVSALDEAVVAQWEKAKEKRFRTLLLTLDEGEQFLTEEVIQQEDFIFAFVSTARASILTKRKEKINLFAQLLKNATRRNMLSSEEFEENLNILDELSLHELKLLLLYKKHEDRLKERHEENPGDHRKPQWEAFAQEAENDLSLPREFLSSTLSRLSRTGLYEVHTGIVSSDTLGNGHITAKCIDFLNWILDESKSKQL